MVVDTMTNDGWGSKWPSGVSWFDKPKVEDNPWETILKQDSRITPEMLDAKPLPTGLDLGAEERTVLTTFKGNEIKHKIISQTEFKSQGSNLVDAQAYLYFQCDGCQAILDPHTKSFRALQEYRVNAGWACKWNIDGMGYKVYCAKCGEKMK